MIIEDETRYVTLGLKIHICNMSILYFIFSIVHKFKLILLYSNCKNVDLYTVQTRGGKSTKIFYSSKSTITLLKFYLSTSKSTSLKIYSSKSKK